jgi:hypothetical protein
VELLHPFPQYVFIAQCSVTGRDNFTFTLLNRIRHVCRSIVTKLRTNTRISCGLISECRRIQNNFHVLPNIRGCTPHVIFTGTDRVSSIAECHSKISGSNPGVGYSKSLLRVCPKTFKMPSWAFKMGYIGDFQTQLCLMWDSDRCSKKFRG